MVDKSTPTTLEKRMSCILHTLQMNAGQADVLSVDRPITITQFDALSQMLPRRFPRSFCPPPVTQFC